jgi:hypothetical protein
MKNLMFREVSKKDVMKNTILQLQQRESYARNQFINKTMRLKTMCIADDCFLIKPLLCHNRNIFLS